MANIRDRSTPSVLVVIGALVVAGCGSTTRGAERQDAGLPGGPIVPGVIEGDVTPGLSGAAPSAASGGNQTSGSHSGGRAGAGGVAVPGSIRPANEPAFAAGRQVKPIQLGLLITETGAYLKAFGIPSQAQFSRDSVHAFVKSLNAAGGVAGRKLEVIDHFIEIASADTNSEYQAACTKFTQDNHVDAVIYDGIAYHQGFNACLTKAGVPLLVMGSSGGTNVGDVTDLANHPGLVAFNAANTDRRLRSILNKALAAGFLHAGSKLGVFVEACAYNLRPFSRTLVPIVTRAKVSIHRQDARCAQSSSDQSDLVSELQGAALRWKTENVDSVMFVTSFENGYAQLFATGAEQQQYYPQYLLFRSQGDSGSMSWFSRESLVKMRGFGGMPIWNVTYPPKPPPPQAAVQKNCLSIAARSGITPADYGQRSLVFNACDAVSLLRRALTLSGGQAGTRHLVPAIERIGNGFVSALTLNGATRFGPGSHDGMELTAVSVFKDKCSCFEYITRPSPIT